MEFKKMITLNYVQFCILYYFEKRLVIQKLIQEIKQKNNCELHVIPISLIISFPVKVSYVIFLLVNINSYKRS